MEAGLFGFVEGQIYFVFDSTTMSACKLIYSRRNDEGWPVFRIHPDHVHMPMFSGISPVDGRYHYSAPNLSVFYTAKDCYQAQIDRLTEKMNNIK